MSQQLAQGAGESGDGERRKGELKGGAARAKKLLAMERTAKADHVWSLEHIVTLKE